MSWDKLSKRQDQFLKRKFSERELFVIAIQRYVNNNNVAELLKVEAIQKLFDQAGAHEAQFVLQAFEMKYAATSGMPFMAKFSNCNPSAPKINLLFPAVDVVAAKNEPPLKNILQLYKTLVDYESSHKCDKLYIPILQAQRFSLLKRWHWVLLEIDFTKEKPCVTLYDPKKYTGYSLRPIQKNLVEFFGDSSFDFNARYVGVQSIFNERDCGRYVARFFESLVKNGSLAPQYPLSVSERIKDFTYYQLHENSKYKPNLVEKPQGWSLSGFFSHHRSAIIICVITSMAISAVLAGLLAITGGLSSIPLSMEIAAFLPAVYDGSLYSIMPLITTAMLASGFLTSTLISLGAFINVGINYILNYFYPQLSTETKMEEGQIKKLAEESSVVQSRVNKIKKLKKDLHLKSEADQVKAHIKIASQYYKLNAKDTADHALANALLITHAANISLNNLAKEKQIARPSKEEFNNYKKEKLDQVDPFILNDTFKALKQKIETWQTECHHALQPGLVYNELMYKYKNKFHLGHLQLPEDNNDKEKIINRYNRYDIYTNKLIGLAKDASVKLFFEAEQVTNDSFRSLLHGVNYLAPLLLDLKNEFTWLLKYGHYTDVNDMAWLEQKYDEHQIQQIKLGQAILRCDQYNSNVNDFKKAFERIPHDKLGFTFPKLNEQTNSFSLNY